MEKDIIKGSALDVFGPDVHPLLAVVWDTAKADMDRQDAWVDELNTAHALGFMPDGEIYDTREFTPEQNAKIEKEFQAKTEKPQRNAKIEKECQAKAEKSKSVTIKDKKRLDCKHGVPMVQITDSSFKNVCGFCTHTKKIFSMPSPGERFIDSQQIFLTEEEEREVKDETHERDLFSHWEYGEAQIGQMAHIDSMRPLDRLIVESAVPSSEKVNRINYAGVEDRRPYFDRLDTLARFMHVVDEIGRPEPIAEVTLTAFRALDLNERDRRKLALQIASNHSKIHDLTAAVEEAGQEIIPPYPVDIAGCDTVESILSLDQWTQDIDGSEESDDLEPIEKAFTSEIGPMDQRDLYATPIGHAEGKDYMTSERRSAKYQTIFNRVALAVQTDNGKDLSQIGKDIHDATFPGREKGVMFHLHKVATNKTAARLEHRLEVLLETIHNHPKPWKLGKLLSGLQKDKTPSTHRTETPVDRWMLRSRRASAWKMETTYETNGGRPKFTTTQWSMIWEAYRARVPKRQAPEQIPMFEPPAF